MNSLSSTQEPAQPQQTRSELVSATTGRADTHHHERDQAVENLMVDLMPDLVRYFYRRVGDPEMAADFTSDTLAIVWEKRRKLPWVASEQRAWSFGVARRVLMNHSRKNERRDRISDTLRDSVRCQVDAAESVAVKEDHQRAIDALRGLAQKDQEILQLVIWDGLKLTEVGVVLGLRPATARKRYTRALNRLRAAYQVQ